MKTPGAARGPPDPVAAFRPRCEDAARRFDDGDLDLHDAVDALQEDAVRSGLVEAIGQDAVQWIMAEAFRPFRSDLAIMTGKLTVTCSEFRAIRQNTLRGFARISIREMRLSIYDVSLHQKGANRWAQLPSKPQVRDGVLVKDPAGKVQYTPVMEFTGREVREAFSARVVEAVLAIEPHAFDAEPETTSS